MHRIQELVRPHRLGQGQRSIAQQLQMGRETIRTYQGKLREAADDVAAEDVENHVEIVVRPLL